MDCGDLDQGQGSDSNSLVTIGKQSGELESELENVCRELGLVERTLADLLERQSALSSRKDQLSAELKARRSRLLLPQHDWAGDNFEWSEALAKLLKDAFGISNWRTNQKEIINATLSGRDVFAVMRTGGGKSLCYQLPAVLKGGITVVVSPLISLIEDQARHLNDMIPGSAATLSAGMGKKETADVYKRMRGDAVEGKFAKTRLVMVLVTPEKVAKSKMFMAALDATARNGRLSRVVIDEAHCCSQWGHDFRPEYCKLGILKRQYAHVPVLAVTATCTDFIRNDVMNILNLSPGDVMCFKSSFNRSNLRYEVVDKPEAANAALEQLARFIQTNYNAGAAGIVYTFSRREACEVATGLVERGVSAAYYHAGQEGGERTRIQQAWMKGDIPVIVATIAFGMGINHLEVRFVVHFSLSKSVENYYQESGRAGRDGNPSRCVVFYRPSDVSRQATLSCQEQGSQPLATLHKMVTYCQSTTICRRKMIAGVLEECAGGDLCRGTCDVCSGAAPPVTTINATRHAKTLVRILRHLASKEQRVTLKQLVEAWRVKKGVKAMPEEVVGDSRRPCGLSRSTCERFVLRLLGLGVLSDDFHFTAFSVIHYVVTGVRAHAVESGRLEITLEVPDAEAQGAADSAATSSPEGKNKKVPTSRAEAKGGAASGGNCRGTSAAGSGPRNSTTTDGPSGGISCRGKGKGICGKGGGAGGEAVIGSRGPGVGKKRSRAGAADDEGAAVVDLCDSDDDVPDGSVLRDGQAGHERRENEGASANGSLDGERTPVSAEGARGGCARIGRGGRSDGSSGSRGRGDAKTSVSRLGAVVNDDSDFEQPVLKSSSNKKKPKKHVPLPKDSVL